MTEVLLLGASGRTGTALLRHRPTGVRLHAGVRAAPGSTAHPLPAPEHADSARAVDLDDPVVMRQALTGVDVVVNAIRLREAIPPTALTDLHQRITHAHDNPTSLLVIHVGGAGSLHLGHGHRFWQDPTFPATTLPRGAAHAALRDHLESQPAPHHWAYLVPPPAYQPQGPFTGTYHTHPPATDEHTFLQHSISYQDFALALADAVHDHWTGTHLVSA